MTDNIMTLIDYLRKVGLQEDLGFWKKATEYLAQQVVDLDAEEVIGAKKYEQTDTRTNQRNGARERTLETRVGKIELEIPKQRKGTDIPSILERRNMIPDAFVQGIATCKAKMVLEAKEDTLVYKTFPEEYHQSLRSVNTLKSLNREIRRRTQVVGVFPDCSSVCRLVGTLLVNTDEDQQTGRCLKRMIGVEKDIFK